jgi:hypothetical protein
MAYAKWAFETPVFRCERCGTDRPWGMIMLGVEDVETKRALLQCEACRAVTWHAFTGLLAEGNVENDPCLAAGLGASARGVDEPPQGQFDRESLVRRRNALGPAARH